MKIGLVSIPYESKQFRFGESLGLKQLAACLLANGFSVDIFDATVMGLSTDELVNSLKDSSYTIIGFSVLFTTHLDDGLRLAESVKRVNQNALIIVGGQGVSFLWESALKKCSAVDFAVCFEGENTLLELVKTVFNGRFNYSNIPGIFYRIGGRISFTGFRNPNTNLDSLPFPIRDSTSRILNQPHYAIISSRGCNGKCSFCASGYFGNRYHKEQKWRARNPYNVCEEIDILVKDYGASAVSFVDDNFLGSSQAGFERARIFSRLLLKKPYNIKWSMECRADDVDRELFEEMRSAGLEHVFLGIDSGNRADLRLFSKDMNTNTIEKALQIIRDIGLSLTIGFIMFHPLSTIELLEENLYFLRINHLASYQSLTNKLEIYPGSPLIKYYSNRGLLYPNNYSIDYSYADDRIRIIREILRKSLKPFIDYEVRIAKATFKVQTGDCSEKLSFHERNKILAQINKMRNEISGHEIDIAEKTVLLASQCATDDINISFQCNIISKELEDIFLDLEQSLQAIEELLNISIKPN